MPESIADPSLGEGLVLGPNAGPEPRLQLRVWRCPGTPVLVVRLVVVLGLGLVVVLGPDPWLVPCRVDAAVRLGSCPTRLSPWPGRCGPSAHGRLRKVVVWGRWVKAQRSLPTRRR
jgi:hypothetical protein